jgi:hypothetical protein
MIAAAGAGLGCLGNRATFMLCSLAWKLFGGSEKTKMTTDPKRKALQDNADRDRRRQQEAALDEALKNTFPASDPVSAVQPGHDPCKSEDTK